LFRHGATKRAVPLCFGVPDSHAKIVAQMIQHARHSGEPPREPSKLISR
jgi:hypothetical protein